MRKYINDNNLVIITETKAIRFDLTKEIDNSLKHEIDFIIKHNRVLAEHRIESKISELLYI